MATTAVFRRPLSDRHTRPGRYNSGMTAAPLVHELIPCPDPWGVARKLAHLPHLCFFDSSERGGERGRYSYVMAEPKSIYLRPTDPLTRDRVDPFRTLQGLLPNRHHDLPGLPPFRGGMAGLLGYELSRDVERIPAPPQDEFRTPTVAVGVYEWVVSFDHQQGRAWLVCHGSDTTRRIYRLLELLNTPLPLNLRSSDLPLKGGGDASTSPLEGEVGTLRVPGGGSPSASLTPQHPLPHHRGVMSNFSREEYINAVGRAVEYVHAGDVFQVNLSQRLLTPLTEHPLELYGRLRQTSPSPFGCYFDLGDFQILSSSPERFLQLSADGEVSTRPIKGTRPRGKTPAEDAELLRDLTTNPKDRAENVMIVDLLRNDLGRVCEYGSVRVPAVCEVESFRHVHHLVSEVSGKLRPGMTAFDLLRASFPGGSVTGAPKVRAMEIIAELEPTARGPYCGSVGWIGFDGAMDTNILIRTFTAGRGWLQFPVGGGIVADSDPATEYEETLHKAAGMLRALQR